MKGERNGGKEGKRSWRGNEWGGGGRGGGGRGRKSSTKQNRSITLNFTRSISKATFNAIKYVGVVSLVPVKGRYSADLGIDWC